MRMKLSNLPKDSIKHYKLSAKNTKGGYVYKNMQWILFNVAGILVGRMGDSVVGQEQK